MILVIPALLEDQVGPCQDDYGDDDCRQDDSYQKDSFVRGSFFLRDLDRGS